MKHNITVGSLVKVDVKPNIEKWMWNVYVGDEPRPEATGAEDYDDFPTSVPDGTIGLILEVREPQGSLDAWCRLLTTFGPLWSTLTGLIKVR